MKKAKKASFEKNDASGAIKKAFIISVIALAAVVAFEKITQPVTPSKPIENLNIPSDTSVNINSDRNP